MIQRSCREAVSPSPGPIGPGLRHPPALPAPPRPPASSRYPFVPEKLDVIEQELPAVGEVTSRGGRPSARSIACARIHGLRSTPRPTSTPSTPLAELGRRSAPARRSRRCRTPECVRRSAISRDQIPVRQAAVALRGRPAVHGHRRRARVLDHPGQHRRVRARRRSSRRAS